MVTDQTPSVSPSPAASAATTQVSKFRATFWGSFLGAAGLALEAAAVAGWGTGRWPDVFVSVGAGALLAGFVMFLEPRLVRDVQRATSTTARQEAAHEARNRTRELDERLSRLESISEVQDQVRKRRHHEAAQRTERVRATPDYGDVEAMLADADSRELFSQLWLKCGTNKNLLLSFRRMEGWRGTGEYVGRSIHVTLGSTTARPTLPVGIQESRDNYMESRYNYMDTVVHSEWRPSETFEDAYRRFHEQCERSNVSADAIDFAAAFASLADSYGLMVNSRNSDEEAALRLARWLTLRVNDEWVVTDNGRRHLLEELLSNHVYHSWPLAADGGTDGGPCPPGYDPALWEDALFYAQRFLSHTPG